MIRIRLHSSGVTSKRAWDAVLYEHCTLLFTNGWNLAECPCYTAKINETTTGLDLVECI